MSLMLQNIDRLISKYENHQEVIEDLNLLKDEFKEQEEKRNRNSTLNNHLFSSLLHNLPEMDVYLFDQNLKILLAGGREKLKYGFSNDELIGESVKEVNQKYFKDVLLTLSKEALQGNFQQSEVRYKKKYYKVISQPVENIQGKVEYGILIVHNITKLKKVQDKLKKAKDDAENVAKAKSAFLANMSHEIRTPLNAIIGFSEQLSKTQLKPEQSRYNELINESSEHLLSLVSDILILLKIGMEKVYIENIPFDIRKVCADTCDFFRLRAEKKGLELSFNVDCKVPEVLIGDPFRLKQILINLLSNAIKFTDNGYVRFACQVQNLKNNKIQLQFIVEDSGIGFSPQESNIIFDEFRQASNMIREHHGGTGLGLTISKRLIELQKGKIAVKSVINKGTSFSIIIPYQIGEINSLPENERSFVISNHYLEGKQMLLADDDVYNRELAKIIFKNWGVKLDLAVDGGEALDLVQYKKYDAILLDIHMPRADGTQVAKYIRSEEDCLNYETKIVAITANVVKDDIVKYLKSGMDTYIIKPFKEEDLFNKLCNVLNSEEKENLSTMQNKEKVLQLEENKNKAYDLKDLHNATKGNVLLFNKMLQTFLGNCKEALEQFDNALQVKDWGSIRETAHRMVSSIKYFKMEVLARNLKEIEQLIVDGKVDKIESKIEIASQDMIKMMKNLEKEML